MATEIKMPQLSDTMSAGKILSWNKQEGEVVSRGDILAEVETDKANLEIECFHPGTLLKIITPADSEAKVGEVIAYVGKAGEEVPSATGGPQNGSGDTDSADANSGDARGKELREAKSHTPRNGNGSQGSSSHRSDKASSDTIKRDSAEHQQSQQNESSRGDRDNTPKRSTVQNSERIKASPLARRLAEQHGIELSQVSGSGPDGRIIKRDIEEAQRAPSQQSPSQEALQRNKPASLSSALQKHDTNRPSGGARGAGEFHELSKMRRTIAERMQQSVTEAPHFYTTTSIDMEQAVALQKSLKQEPGYEKLSLNHLIIKAAARALRKVPEVNCAFRDNAVFEPASVNIGMITALDGGLIIPVLHEVDCMSLSDVAFEARAAIERARAGRPSSSDLSGGTFSISNMGMFDVENFTAIINPGQGAVLAVSSTREVPVVKNGVIVVGQQMKATLSVDHRIIDGVMAANFLKAFKKALETPALLCMGAEQGSH